jgi:pimeloyl-ACP methyl ester carboxylesterase
MKRVVFAAALAGALLAAAVALGQSRPIADVRLTTTDGVKIVGSYYPPSGAKAKAVILLHMLGRDRADWRHFARKAAAANIACLAIDLRGHGQSIVGANNANLAWKNFKDEKFMGMTSDVQAAYDWLLKQREIDPAHVGIVGASIGANIAAIYAADHPQQIRSVVLLSPGLAYHSVKPAAAVAKFPGKMLFYAAPGDDYAYDSVKQLAASAADRSEVRELPGDAHGTQLFDKYPDTVDKIVAWLGENI